MSKPGQRDLPKERFWRTTFAEFEQSGLTVRAFCTRHKLTESQFYFRRRQLERRDLQDVVTRADTPTQATTFVPVHVTPPVPPAESHIDIQLSDQVSICRTAGCWIIRTPCGYATHRTDRTLTPSLI